MRTSGRRRGAFGYVVPKGTPTDPQFAIRWREGSRLKQRGGFRTRKDAAEALARVRVGLSDGTLVEKRRGSIGFDEVAKEWLRLHSKPNLRSHVDNEERYEKHLKPFFQDAPLTSVTPTRILEFRAKLQAQQMTRRVQGGAGAIRTLQRKLAPRTINLIIALLRSILRFAVSNGHIPASPTDRIGRGKLLLSLERPKLAPPIDTPAEVGRVLAFMRDIGEESRRPSVHPLFCTLVYTGMRRGEALGLRWSDVDLDRRMIIVRRSYAGMTKSSKHRPVPIPAELVSILRAYELADPWKCELVFPNDAGGMYSRNAKLEEVLQEALRRAGLRRVRVHDLRHQYASDFIRRGGDIFTLQRILGHSTPTLTSETYAHLSPTHLAGEADRISYPEPAAPAVVLPFEMATA